MIIQAHTVNQTTVSSVLVQPWFGVLVMALAVERLSGLALGVAMERDWVVLVTYISSSSFCFPPSLISLLILMLCLYTFFFVVIFNSWPEQIDQLLLLKQMQP